MKEYESKGIPMTVEFESFGKIERYEKANATITEKIDGSNACIVIDETGVALIQSRKRALNVGKQNDNFGFAQWVRGNEQEIIAFFGHGRHYGEWFGCGIQRGYGMRERCFAPFNTGLFPEDRVDWIDGVVPTPVLWQGMLCDLSAGVEESMDILANEGSQTKPGFAWTAEGCMIWSRATGYLKVPFEGAHKWEQLPKGVAA